MDKVCSSSYFCPFCLDNANEMASDVKYSVGSRIIKEYDSFYVVPTLGALEVGHILVISKKHVFGFSDLSISNKKELTTIYLEWKGILKSVYGCDVSVFQHGVESMSGNGCLDHFHMHLFPQKIDIYDVVDKALNLKAVSGFENINEKGDYIYFENASEKKGISYMDVVPSQLIRKLYVSEAGGVWDWRSSPNQEKMLRTYRDLVKSV